MRVIAGQAKGKRLKAPPGMNTRPITDMIKEALFNVLGDTVRDSSFLDLFAGSGSVGIEALSRGAKQVVFIDNNSSAVGIIKENIINCGFSKGFSVYRNDVFKALTLFDQRKTKFDLIYVDPPFTIEKIFDPVIYALDQSNILERNGRIILRTQRKKQLTAQLNYLEEYRTNNYGESVLHYYRMYEEVKPNDGNFQNT
ncbi:MAG TPA: 16S rRNA (guanine(966)-N(2))-methyltransferase RsmD [Syntrophomonadaceae bacterium]|nr:16S rRNA (guanine(966)-N(2))-methyltransferase RsmD [Syntrophomonadaceae bacterium]